MQFGSKKVFPFLNFEAHRKMSSLFFLCLSLSFFLPKKKKVAAKEEKAVFILFWRRQSEKRMSILTAKHLQLDFTILVALPSSCFFTERLLKGFRKKEGRFGPKVWSVCPLLSFNLWFQLLPFPSFILYFFSEIVLCHKWPLPAVLEGEGERGRERIREKRKAGVKSKKKRKGVEESDWSLYSL